MKNVCIIKLLKGREGTAIIEFALLAPLFFLTIFIAIEFGLFIFHKITIENISVEISRVAALNQVSDDLCPSTNNQIDLIKCHVRIAGKLLINGDRLQVQINTLASGGVQMPDICLDDPSNPSSTPSTCTVYEDVNGTGSYEGIGADDLGNSREIIEALVSYPWSVQLPFMGKYIGSKEHPGVSLITSSTIIKKEPL